MRVQESEELVRRLEAHHVLGIIIGPYMEDELHTDVYSVHAHTTAAQLLGKLAASGVKHDQAADWPARRKVFLEAEVLLTDGFDDNGRHLATIWLRDTTNYEATQNEAAA